MKLKKKKLCLFLILLIPVIILANGISNVKADSGFDTGYDSGGWSSGDSWSSSSSSWSSHDYDYSWSSRDHSSSSSTRRNYTYTNKAYYSDMEFDGPNLVLFCVIAVVMFIFARALMAKRSTNNMRYRSSTNQYYATPKYLSDEEVRKYIPDFDYFDFIEERYEDYVAIQKAWMNFDYDALRKEVTDELYNQYVFQLDSMKIKREQNIMSDFVLDKGNVTGIREQNDKLELTMEMVVSFYDYIVCDGKVTRGSKDTRVTVCYEIVFVCNVSENVDKCPNCHAPLNGSSSQVCEYCRSIITRTGSDWVMAKKTNRKQW